MSLIPPMNLSDAFFRGIPAVRLFHALFKGMNAPAHYNAFVRSGWDP
jgi:hypothetical protein